jgi:hypothetical protein
MTGKYIFQRGLFKAYLIDLLASLHELRVDQRGIRQAVYGIRQVMVDLMVSLPARFFKKAQVSSNLSVPQSRCPETRSQLRGAP